MRCCRGIRQRNRDLEDPLESHPALGDQLGEPLALHELHGEELKLLILLDGQDSEDVGISGDGEGVGLSLKPFRALLTTCQFGRKHLQRNLTLEGRILGPLHLSHLTRAELL